MHLRLGEIKIPGEKTVKFKAEEMKDGTWESQFSPALVEEFHKVGMLPEARKGKFYVLKAATFEDVEIKLTEMAKEFFIKNKKNVESTVVAKV